VDAVHWILAVAHWHAVNVAGNIVASAEMGALLLLAGRPLLRRLRAHLTADLREHVTTQVEHHVGGLHARLDTLALRVIDGNDEPPGSGSR
jgi:hypothetical protein